MPDQERAGEILGRVGNPGSELARTNGCKCAALDNNHGRFPVFTDAHGFDQWWVRSDCPLHGEGSEYVIQRAREIHGG